MNAPDIQLVRWIAQGLDGDDRYTVPEVLDGLATGRFHLFRYPNGIVITTFTAPRRLLVFLLAGEGLDSWKSQATSDLKAFARFHGVTVVEAYCRPGLRPVLKSEGWRHRQDVLRLDLG